MLIRISPAAREDSDRSTNPVVLLRVTACRRRGAPRTGRRLPRCRRTLPHARPVRREPPSDRSDRTGRRMTPPPASSRRAVLAAAAAGLLVAAVAGAAPATADPGLDFP